MHVLHRPHQLHGAALAAVTAAVLAIVLTLAIAGGLNGLRSTPTSASAPTPPASVQAATLSPLIRNPLTHGPFTVPFIAPIRLPWLSASR